MNEREHRAIGRAWRSERPWEVLTGLTELGNRMGGHPGEERAAELVAAELEAAGAREVSIEGFEMTRWDRGGAELAVTDPSSRRFEALALPYSPAGEVVGELVDVGAGTPEEIQAADLEGAIALASTTTPEEYGRFVHRMEKYGHAVEAGAAAFVFHNHVPGQLPPTGALRFDEVGRVPGIGVSRETGGWLAEYADRGGRSRIEVEAGAGRGTGHNAHGVLGPETDEEVLLVAHHDAHDVAEGALDNGCGVAIIATAARLLASFDLEARVRVAGVGCEEIGLLGAEALADRLDLDSVHAVVNVDGAGRFRDLRAFPHGSEGMAALIDRVEEATNQPIAVEDRTHPFSDHWPFLRSGVPSIQLHSESGERGRGWGHTAADTREKVDDRNLRGHAIVTAVLVRELARAEPERLDPGNVADALREADLEAGMRAAGIWPEAW